MIYFYKYINLAAVPPLSVSQLPGDSSSTSLPSPTKASIFPAGAHCPTIPASPRSLSVSGSVKHLVPNKLRCLCMWLEWWFL